MIKPKNQAAVTKAFAASNENVRKPVTSEGVLRKIAPSAYEEVGI